MCYHPISPGKCFSDPDKCRNHGMTIMASLKLDKKYFHKKSSSYFLSSGGQTTQARGFALLHILNRYILILSTKDNQWKLETRDLPDGWFNIAFSWEKKGLLKLYVNGQEKARGEAMSVLRPKDSFSSLQVGRPNNSHSPKFRVPLEIDNITLWEKALTSKEIGTLADKGKNWTSIVQNRTYSSRFSEGPSLSNMLPYCSKCCALLHLHLSQNFFLYTSYI